jgi:hypothetical protein
MMNLNEIASVVRGAKALMSLLLVEQSAPLLSFRAPY